jgi:hypothetical protein
LKIAQKLHRTNNTRTSILTLFTFGVAHSVT